MSKTLSKNQASKSSPEDALGKIPKSIQKVESHHHYSGDRTSLDPCEARDKTPKRKPSPAHEGPRSVSEVDETVTKKNRETKR